MDLICQMRYGLRYHITLLLPFDAKSNSADTVQKNPSKNVLSQMIKTVSIRKLNDFNFQWTRLSFQNISSHIAFLFTLFKGYRCTVIRVNPLLSPPGGLFFSSTFQEGFIEREGLIQFSEMHQREKGFSTTDLWFPGVILLFLTIRKL